MRWLAFDVFPRTSQDRVTTQVAPRHVRYVWTEQRSLEDAMRRWERAVAVSAAVGLVTTLAACGDGGGGGGAGSTSPGGTTTLTMWGRSDNEGFLPDLVDAFNASHDDITIDLTLVPAEQVAQKFTAAAAGGASPDLVSLDVATVPQYATAGWLRDVTAEADALDYRDELSPSHLELATVDDHLYALPFTADVSVLYYNKGLFERAGLDPETAPATWDEIRADAQAIAALGDGSTGYYFSGACAGCMAFTLLPYVWAQGGDVLSGGGDAAGATISPNPALESTLELFHGLWADGVVDGQSTTDTGADQFGPFFSGTAGMFVNGSYPYATLVNEYPDVDFGMTVVPSQDGGSSAAYTGGDSIAVTTAAVDADAALSALTWFTDEGQRTLAEAGVLPTRLDIAQDVYVASDPRLQTLVDALKVGHTPNSVDVAALFFDNNGPWSSLMQSAIFDGDIAGAMSAAQDEMDTILGG